MESETPKPLPRAVDPPAAVGAMAPELTAVPSGVALSWLEPVPVGHRLRLAHWSADGWSVPRTIVEGEGFFANWADFPAVVRSEGDWFAHWLEKVGEGTYAYGVRLAGSQDGGVTWTALGWLHEDRSPTEHGFVSWVPWAGGAQAFWLDGRELAVEGGEEPAGRMQLRTAHVAGERISGRTLLDASVCDCCQTSAAVAASGPVVAYRDRSVEEVRDIAVVRSTASGWSEPSPVAGDGWQIHGCPVNGPAIDAAGDRVVVAWFTAAEGVARVRLAFSEDGGATFGEAVMVDEAEPLGRVSVVLHRSAAQVLWLGSSGERAEVRLRSVAADGRLGPIRSVAATSAERAAGFPRAARWGDDLFVTWVEPAEAGSRLRSSVVPVDGP